jgi:glycerol-3-phosphate acyltransferase PlsY
VNLALLLIAAYLLGSIPTSYIVVHALTGRDIRTVGTGNPGTMNVLDHVGFWPAFIVGAGDISKGMAAVAIAYLTGFDDVAAVAAGMAAVIGHDFSVFMRLHGGNGMAAAIGGMYGLLPLPAFIATSLAVAAYLIFRSRRYAGLIGIFSIPFLAVALGAPDVKLVGVLLLFATAALKILRSEGFSPARSRPHR